MALLPARRSGTLSRPGSRASARWDPFAEFEDLDQRMGQLMSGAFDGGWQPPVQAWAPLAGLSETGQAYLAEAGLPGVAKDDISAGLAGQELVISGESPTPATKAARCAAGAARAGSSTGSCYPARPRRARSPRSWPTAC